MLLQIIGSAAIIFGIIALIYKLEGQGRKSEQNEQRRRALEDIHEADRIRDSLKRDPAAARRVRERFTC